MADEAKTDDTSQDSGQVEDNQAVDTSTNEDTQDTDDLELEDIEVTDDEAEVDETDESDESEETEETTEESNETEEESEEDVEEESQEETSTDEEETQEDTKSDIAQEAYKRREAERKLREAEEQRERENLERYLQEAEDDEDEFKARQMDVQQYLVNKDRANLNREKLEAGIQKVVDEFDIKNASEAEKRLFAEAVDEFERGYIQVDRNGNPVQVNGDIYQHLKNKVNSTQEIKAEGARSAGKAKAKTKARTVTPPIQKPKEPKVDQDVKDFDDAWE